MPIFSVPRVTKRAYVQLWLLCYIQNPHENPHEKIYIPAYNLWWSYGRRVAFVPCVRVRVRYLHECTERMLILCSTLIVPALRYFMSEDQQFTKHILLLKKCICSKKFIAMHAFEFGSVWATQYALATHKNQIAYSKSNSLLLLSISSKIARAENNIFRKA